MESHWHMEHDTALNGWVPIGKLRKKRCQEPFLRAPVRGLTLACSRRLPAFARPSLCAVKAVWKHVETPLGIQVPIEPLERSAIDHSLA